MDQFLRAMLELCGSNFGLVPRRFSLWERLTYLNVGRPDWLAQNRDDRLNQLFDRLPHLFRDGKVVLGQVIQANVNLFSPGRKNYPAEFVYSVDDPDLIPPTELARVAHAIFALKGDQPDDPALASIGRYLADGYIRVFGGPVPGSISPDHSCRISTAYVVRKHLPGPRRHLRQNTLPLVVLTANPNVALPLPSRYWPQPLIDWWNFRSE